MIKLDRCNYLFADNALNKSGVNCPHNLDVRNYGTRS